MWKDAILAYLHLAAILPCFGFSRRTWTLLKAGAHSLQLQRLASADIGFALAALAVLASGTSRLLFGAKPIAFYTGNPAFHIKVSLFVLAALISIRPTIAFLQWRKAAAANATIASTNANGGW